MGAQHIFHGLGGAVGGVLTGQSGQDLNASLVAGLLIALTAHVGGVVALLAVDDDGLGAVAGLPDGPLAALIGSVHVGGAHEGGLALDPHVGVDAQNGDALIQSGLQRVGGSAGIVGGADDGVAAGADLLLDLGDLALDVALSAGAHDVNFHAQLCGSGIAAGLHIAPVLGGQGLQNNRDLVVVGGLTTGLLVCGVIGGIIGGGVIAAAACHQGQRHDEREEKCKKLLHLTSFLLLD